MRSGEREGAAVSALRVQLGVVRHRAPVQEPHGQDSPGAALGDRFGEHEPRLIGEGAAEVGQVAQLAAEVELAEY